MNETDSSFSPQELKRCIEIMEAINQNRMLLGEVNLDERKALLMAAGKMSRPDKLEVMKISKRHRRQREKALRANDRESRAKTHIREARAATVFVAPPRIEIGKTHEPGELNEPRNCYVCKSEFRKLHFFYDSMCTPCGDFNYAKRFQTAPLHGKVAVITGSRVKIGYHAALMMLRAGASVVVTTRFPHDAAERYSREKDYAEWKDRLRIYGLDLRHAPSVEIFANHLVSSLDRLDILINNAAQTVRRPPGFYRHLMESEQASLNSFPEALRGPLEGHDHLKARLLASQTLSPLPTIADSSWLAQCEEPKKAIGISASAALSQAAHTFSEEDLRESAFPADRRDADLQQVDLREKNSWRMTLAEVGTPELLEVQLVNAVAPYILCAKLKPLFLRYPEGEKHIVNVSAMEGKFTRYTKTDKHPHTNMAKAALNMMTLTSAPDYVKDNIYMNAVDTGWVTDEDPAAIAAAKTKEHDFQPPLDIVDGAARICDPFFSGYLTGNHVYGKFLKDYAPTTW